jgi:hypothetical protein
MKLPQRHEDTKNHKGFVFNDLALVIPIAIGISALAPWWQKIYFSDWTQKV